MTVLLAAASENVTIISALGYSLLGFSIVFAALVILWFIINIMSSFMKKGKAKAQNSETTKEAPAAAVPAAPVAPAVTAPGSAGDLKIHDVPEKTAAILMAIVANKMNRPLNELRFISIKEVK